jgi:hypothetical protein
MSESSKKGKSICSPGPTSLELSPDDDKKEGTSSPDLDHPFSPSCDIDNGDDSRYVANITLKRLLRMSFNKTVLNPVSQQLFTSYLICNSYNKYKSYGKGVRRYVGTSSSIKFSNIFLATNVTKSHSLFVVIIMTNYHVITNMKLQIF